MKQIGVTNFLHIGNKTFALLNTEPMLDGEEKFFVTVVMTEGRSVELEDGRNVFPHELGKVYPKNHPHWIEERPTPLERWLEE